MREMSQYVGDHKRVHEECFEHLAAWLARHKQEAREVGEAETALQLRNDYQYLLYKVRWHLVGEKGVNEQNVEGREFCVFFSGGEYARLLKAIFGHPLFSYDQLLE